MCDCARGSHVHAPGMTVTQLASDVYISNEAVVNADQLRFCQRGKHHGQATFLVCHGAWSAGWAWKKMHPLMHAAGHRLVTPTYTGLGEREHLANPSIDLETHIAGHPQRHQIRRPARHRADRPQLWRHGRNRRGRPRAGPHRAVDLSRCVRAAGRTVAARSQRAGAAADDGSSRNPATAGGCRRIRRRRIRRRPISNG